MANGPQGLLSFIGNTGSGLIENLVSGSFTLVHGITPSVCQVEMDPQADFIEMDGTLTFYYPALSETIIAQFPDCRVDYQTIQLIDQGFLWRLHIMDRRWKWRYNGNSLSGSYNVRNPDIAAAGGIVGNSLDPDFKKTPQELAKLCLDAMNEVGYDTSQMPNDSYPEVNWSFENPAQALAALCDQLGCRVVLRLDNTVLIAKTGVGIQLDETLPLITDSLTINPPERPDSISIICGRNRYQIDIELEAVGLDTDGTVKVIDALSYKPPNGWGFEVPGLMWGISDIKLANGQIPRQLAQQTVYRWYRLAFPLAQGDDKAGIGLDGKDLNIAGYGTIDKLKFLLPIEDVKVDTFVDFDGTLKSQLAEVFGSYIGKADLKFEVQPFDPGKKFTPYGLGFSIDTERGIVMFDNDVHLLDDNGKYSEAKLFLTCAVSVRDKDDNSYERFTVDRNYTDNLHGTGPREVNREEIVAQYTPVYDQNGTVMDQMDNEDSVTQECNYWLDATELEFQLDLPQEITYSGLYAIDLDGAIQQITWSVGASGATTRVCRNNEFSPNVAPFRTRRFFEEFRNGKIADLKKQAAKLASQPANPGGFSGFFRPPT